jgi:hypothetical protein
MRRTGAVLAAIAAALACASVAAASAAQDAALARRGITHAVKQRWLKQPDADRYWTLVARAVWDARRLPPLRGRAIASQLAQLTTLWDSYTSPRALALFSQLQANLAYLETHRIPAPKTDIADADGVVYRWFAGDGFEFHPLASFGALNNLAAAQDADATRTLADALLARGIPHGRRLIWEYAFPFGGGRPPWASGMAQAVAAQALARSGVLLRDPSLLAAAGRAYASVPPLLLQLPSGPWVRLYGFDRELVLNAQLQAILSVAEYAQASGDASAGALATRLTAAAQTLFPRFDTGDWSLYELGGAYAPREYEQFVTQELTTLATRTQDPFWQAAAKRFYDYLYTAPRVTEGTPPPTLYPQPQDGWLDVAQIPITLSQRASVTLAVAGKVTSYRLGAGTHVLTWKPPAELQPGTYPAQVSAVTYAGNRSTTNLAPIVVAFDTTPPQQLTATYDGATLTWSAVDPGTPWLELQLDLVDPSGVAAPQTLDLGHEPLAGSAPVTLPPGTWQVTLAATNSAALTATFPVGTFTSSG